MEDNRPPEPPPGAYREPDHGQQNAGVAGEGPSHQGDNAPSAPSVPPQSPTGSPAIFGQEHTASPGASGNTIRRSVHHTYVWLGSLRVVFMIFVALVFASLPAIMQGMAQGSRGASGWIYGGGFLIGFAVLLIVMLLFQFLSYKNLSYELGPDEFSLYSGILNKKRVHVPYQRVQSVNQRMSLIQRIFGVCTVYVDTAGGSTNKAVVVPYLLNTDAEWLRGELFARKQALLEQYAAASGKSVGQASEAQVPPAARVTNVLDTPAEIISDIRGVFGGERVDTGAVSYQYGLTNKELFFTGLSSNTGAIVMVLAFVGLAISLITPFLETMVGRYAVEQGLARLTQAFTGELIGAFIGLLVVVFAIAWIVSIISTMILYGGFRACRRQSRIEVEHGLLQHRFHGVDIDRVQSVIIRQSFIRRCIGYCEVSLGKIDAAQDAQDQDKGLNRRGVIVHPFVKIKNVPEILNGLVPEFADIPVETRKLPSVSLRRALIRRIVLKGTGFWIAVIVTALNMLLHAVIPGEAAQNVQVFTVIDSMAIVFYALCFVIAALEAVGAVMWYRGSSFAFNDRFLQISNGGFSRESITLPRKKLQFGFVKTNPLQRMAKVATINARTAVGIGGTTLWLTDVCVDDAEKWLDWVLPRQHVIQ